MKIGIFGATGNVGKGAVAALCKEDDVSIVLYGRNKNNFKEEQKNNISCKELDINDKAKLNREIEEVDLTINCVGPSSIVQDSIAALCLEKGKKYVDVSGGKRLKEIIESDYKVYEKGCCILGAGIYPGLTELIVKAAYEKYEDLDELKLYFYGNSPLSFNAAYDIVDGMKNAGGGMSFVRNGREVKILKPQSNKSGNTFFKGRTLMPIVGDEFLDVCKRTGIGKAYFYHSFENEKELMDFVMIKANEQYKTDEEMRQSSNLIQDMFFKDDRPKEVKILLELMNDDESISKEYSFLLDWSIVTGLVAGYAAMDILKKEVSGVHYLSQVVNANNILEKILNFKGIES